VDAGAQLGVAETLEALAKDAEPDPAATVRLVARAAAIREAIGAPIEPVELAELEQQLARARVCLGAEAYRSLWEHGRATPVEEAVRQDVGTRI